MASEVDICNLALGKLSQDVGIASFAERSKEARTFARLYEHQRDLVLAERIWPFATKAQALAMQTQPPMIGWGYRYTYPADCIQALAVCDESGVRGGVSLVNSVRTCGELCSLPWPNRADFDVHYGDQDTSIAADLAGAFLIYTSRVEDPGRFSAMFIEALACRLALESGPSIIGELGLRLRNQLEQNFELALSKASANAQNEGRESVAPITPSLAARL